MADPIKIITSLGGAYIGVATDGAADDDVEIDHFALEMALELKYHWGRD